MSQRIFHVDTRSLCSRVGSCFRGGREGGCAGIDRAVALMWAVPHNVCKVTELLSRVLASISPTAPRLPSPPRLPSLSLPIRDRRLPWRQSCEVRRGCDPRVFLPRSISISSTDCTTHCPVKVSPHTVSFPSI